MQIPLGLYLKQQAECMGGSGLIGSRLWIYWYDDPKVINHVSYGTWYKAEITGYDGHTGEHVVRYFVDNTLERIFLPCTHVHFGRSAPPPGEAPVMTPVSKARSPDQGVVKSGRGDDVLGGGADVGAKARSPDSQKVGRGGKRSAAMGSAEKSEGKRARGGAADVGGIPSAFATAGLPDIAPLGDATANPVKGEPVALADQLSGHADDLAAPMALAQGLEAVQEGLVDGSDLLPEGAADVSATDDATDGDDLRNTTDQAVVPEVAVAAAGARAVAPPPGAPDHKTSRYR